MKQYLSKKKYMPRQLATIQTIKELLPIKGADNIELATFQDIGWQCVVKKGEFKEKDKCVYFEIDSLLPITPEFEFLASQGTKKTILEDGTLVEGYRLRSRKMRGVLSQGLALPLRTFSMSSGPQGMDLTLLLGIHKYEAPEETAATTTSQPSIRNPFLKFLCRFKFFRSILLPKTSMAFPSFIPKTDETRVQNCWEMVEKYKDLEWYQSLKYDGSSLTMSKHNGELLVCSRNVMVGKIKPKSGNKFINSILKCLRITS